MIRPIAARDAAALVHFHDGLSSETTRMRFFTPHTRLSAFEIEHFTHVDHHDRQAFVAVIDDAIIGVGRFERRPDSLDAEVAFVVADEHQGHGLGSELLVRLARHARDEGIVRLVADTLCDNHPMIAVFERSGFPSVRHIDHGVFHYELSLMPSVSCASDTCP